MQHFESIAKTSYHHQVTHEVCCFVKLSESTGSIQQDSNISEYRFSRVSGIEAYMRWSLERSILWPEHAFSFMMFTVTERLVHVTVTEVFSGMFETHQWLFSSEVQLNEAISAMRRQVNLEECQYIFTPGRVRHYSLSHLGANLTRKKLQNYLPHAKLVHMNNMGRISPRILVRRIALDVRRYVEQLSTEPVLAWYGFANECDALTAAVESDSAAILKFIRTPGYVYLQCAA